MNSLLQLKEHGQSAWLDHFDHYLIQSGELKKRVDEGEISGVTTNPAILAKAIGSDAGYAEDMRALLSQQIPRGHDGDSAGWDAPKRQEGDNANVRSLR